MMYCNQCQQTAGGRACTRAGVCGKTDAVSRLQDGLVAALRRLALVHVRTSEAGQRDSVADDLLLSGLFATLTNVNFDEADLKDRLAAVLRKRAGLAAASGCACRDEALAESGDPEAFLAALPEPGPLAADPDTASAMAVLLYGLKGVAAYAWHAAALGKKDPDLTLNLAKLLAADPSDGIGRSLSDWLGLCLRCGELNVRAMQLLDAANTEAYGDPSPARVALGPKKGHCILISGHDLKDMEALLRQTEGTGIQVYTHGEMLPAHGYPALRAFPHLAGHFGTAWQNQRRELPAFPGPVLFTTNCIQDPSGYADRVFTSGVTAWPGCVHCSGGDFSPVIEKALSLPGFAADEDRGSVLTGFGRAALHGAVPAVLEAVKKGEVRHVFLVGGCDGASPARGYYEEFVAKAPADTLILTLACGKFRFFDKDLGTAGGLPRLIDAGQCNDAYAAVCLAQELAAACGCTVNDLPLSLVLSWYEQKAVAILLSLLHLGVKNIRLGPTLPAFVSPAILSVLAENWGIRPVTTPEADLAACLAGN